MSATRWVLGALFTVGLVSGGSVLVLSQRSSVGAAAPIEGTLASHRPEWVGGWQILGDIAADRIGSGGIVDVAGSRAAAVVLQRGQWFMVTPSGVTGPFGGRVRGDPAWVGRAVAAAVLEDVYLLEAGPSRVSRWSRDGLRLGELPLGPAGTATFLAEELALGNGGAILVSGRRITPSGSEWLVLRFTTESSSADTIYRARIDAPGSGLAVPRITFDSDDQPVVVTSEYEFQVLPATAAAGAAEARRFRRNDPPRWRIDEETLRSYRRTLDRMPEADRTRYALSDRFPLIREVASRPGGGYLVLLAAGADAVLPEVIGARGAARGRLLERPRAEPLFLGSDVVFRIREAMGYTRVEMLTISTEPEV